MINLTNSRISGYNRLDFSLKAMVENFNRLPEQPATLSPQQKLRAVLTAASVALAVPAAQAGEAAKVADVETATVSSAASETHLGDLARLLGEETAREIRVALDECLDEYHEIAAEVKADGGDADEVAEVLELGGEDCGEAQDHDVRIAVLNQQIAAENTKQAAIRTNTAELRARRLQIEADTAELKAIGDELSEMMIGGAICELSTGQTAQECGRDPERMEELFRRARELAAPHAPETVPTDVSEADTAAEATQVASLKAETAKSE